MGIIKITVSDNVEKAFRKIAMAKFGYEKGALSEAAEEAFIVWAASQKRHKDDPVSEMRGLLKKGTSVALQHEAGKILTKKYDTKVHR